MNFGSTTILIGAALALSARSVLTQRTQTGWHGGAPSPAAAEPCPAAKSPSSSADQQ